MTTFQQDLTQSKKIEALFRTHPKFPFLDLNGSVGENVLLFLFLLYMVKPYTNAFGTADWKILWGYESFRIRDDMSGGYGGGMCFYDDISKRQFVISVLASHEDKFNYDRFYVGVSNEDFLAAATEDDKNMLYELGIGIDLRHPLALDKAREFMHAFFIDKLPLEKMQRKIDDFEQFEAHLFKRKQ